MVALSAATSQSSGETILTQTVFASLCRRFSRSARRNSRGSKRSSRTGILGPSISQEHTIWKLPRNYTSATNSPLEASSRWGKGLTSRACSFRCIFLLGAPTTSTKESIMAKMTKNQLIDAIAEGTQVSKGDVKAVIEQMATVGYKELNESGEFVIPGFAKMSVVNKPATEARSGVNPFTKEPMEFAAKPASKSVKASPLKVAKDAV